MKFNKAKCKVLHLVNPWYQYRMRGARIEKALGVLVDEKLDMSSNVCSQPRMPTISWAASREV